MPPCFCRLPDCAECQQVMQAAMRARHERGATPAHARTFLSPNSPAAASAAPLSQHGACGCLLPDCEACAATARQQMAHPRQLRDTQVQVPFLQSCESLPGAAKEIVANYVDFMLRKLLSEGNVVCRGPEWSQLPHALSSSASRTDHLISRLCG